MKKHSLKCPVCSKGYFWKTDLDGIELEEEFLDTCGKCYKAYRKAELKFNKIWVTTHTKED